MNLAEAMRGQLRRERDARSRLEQEIASIKANFAHALLELRNEMLADRLALERQHRAELERIIADGKQPDPEKSSAPSRLKLA